MSTLHPLRRFLLAAVIPVIALTSACGASSGERAVPSSAVVADLSADPVSSPPAPTPAPAEEDVALVARPGVDTPVFDAPEAAVPVQVLPARNEFGSPLALQVIDDDTAGWLQVELPTRPNESTGWILAAGVDVREVDTAVHVDLAARQLVVTDGGEVVLEAPIAIGAPGTPTPTGTFYVVDKIQTNDAGGAYGPFAFGLSAHSDVLTEFAGGDGQVGIHGTNDPTSIGNDVSNGCVRVPNEISEQLSTLLALGTPVTIS